MIRMMANIIGTILLFYFPGAIFSLAMVATEMEEDYAVGGFIVLFWPLVLVTIVFRGGQKFFKEQGFFKEKIK